MPDRAPLAPSATSTPLVPLAPSALPPLHPLHLLRLLLVLLALAWLATGCTSLPPREPPPPSQAFADTGTTALGRVAHASLAEAPTGTSGFRLLPDGAHAFDARIALAQAAERSIDAQYYHVHADTAGAAFLVALRDAAERGVRVRLLLDDFHAGDLYRLLRGLAAHRNVEVRLFNPLLVRYGTPLRRFVLSWREYARINHRMHNKLLLVDNAVAIYGGRNIADEYFARHGSANFIDLDVLSVGAVVPELSASFDRYWNSEQVWSLEQRLHTWEKSLDTAGRRAYFVDRVQQLLGAPLVVTELDPLRQTAVREQLRQGRLAVVPGTAVVHDDPPQKVEMPIVPNSPTAAMRAKLQVIAQARQSVVIVNPYFLPGDEGMRMMREAGERGTQGIIVTNSLGSTDEPLVHRAYAPYRAEMLRLGMQLYEFGPELARRSGNFGSFGESTPRLHAKVAGVDRRWLVVGSVNLDARSALLNTELGVTIDCPPLTEQALGLLQKDAFASMFRLRLAADGRSLEWHARGDDGQPLVLTREPHASWWLDLSLWVQSLFVSEESL
jgi:cardiolipin synthase C